VDLLTTVPAALLSVTLLVTHSLSHLSKKGSDKGHTRTRHSHSIDIILQNTKFSLQHVGSGSSHIIIVAIPVAVMLSRTVIGRIVVDAGASSCHVSIVALCYCAAVVLSRPRTLCLCCDRGGGRIVVVVIETASF